MAAVESRATSCPPPSSPPPGPGLAPPPRHSNLSTKIKYAAFTDYFTVLCRKVINCPDGFEHKVVCRQERGGSVPRGREEGRAGVAGRLGHGRSAPRIRPSQQRDEGEYLSYRGSRSVTKTYPGCLSM